MEQSGSERPSVPFGSNEIRLSSRQWIAAAVILVILICFIPMLWAQFEHIDIVDDYRISYQLSEDYWLYSRYCGMVISEGKIPVIGDSVVWGAYVNLDQTLIHYLNELSGQKKFVNLGVDGMHPLALEGLLTHYGNAVSNSKVILPLNPMWLGSPERDLQESEKEEIQFNHPRLVPQFYPRIYGYNKSVSGRIGILLEQYLGIFGWANHLRLTYFDQSDLPIWTLENPLKNPISVLDMKVPLPKHKAHYEAVPWTERKIEPQNWPWVELDESLQWAAFKRSINLLRQRKNEVFVIIGPLNEYMLTGQSLAKYNELKVGMETWLRDNNIPHCIADILPSELYADSSHPLSRGYVLLAEQLLNNQDFKAVFLSR